MVVGPLSANQTEDKEDENRNMAHTTAQIEANKAVTRDRLEAWEEIYHHLETTEGRDKIYRIATSRKAVREMTVIGKQDVNSITREEKIRERWEPTSTHSRISIYVLMGAVRRDYLVQHCGRRVRLYPYYKHKGGTLECRTIEEPSSW